MNCQAIAKCACRAHELGRSAAQTASTCDFKSFLPRRNHGCRHHRLSALEERVLDRVPKAHLESVLPQSKFFQPSTSSTRITWRTPRFFPTSKLLVNSVLRRWDHFDHGRPAGYRWALEQGDTILFYPAFLNRKAPSNTTPILPQMDRPAPTGQSTVILGPSDRRNSESA